MPVLASATGGGVEVEARTPARQQASWPADWVAVGLLAVTGALLCGRVDDVALLAVAVVAGLPHGALDHRVARRVFTPRFARAWAVPFVAGYLGLFGLVLLCWQLAPVATLAGFLSLSIVHFGVQDVGNEISLRWLRVVAHGGVPMVVPAVVHPDAVSRLFTTLSGNGADRLQQAVSGPAAWLWLAATIATLLSYVLHPRSEARRRAADLVLVAVLFVVATPLVAFSLYFAAIHTPRAARTLARQLGDGATVSGALPLTVAGLVLGAGIFLVGPRLTLDGNIVRTGFVLLSALTVPHMWLDALADRTCTTPARRSSPCHDCEPVACRRSGRCG